jgi:ribosomal protein S13
MFLPKVIYSPSWLELALIQFCNKQTLQDYLIYKYLTKIVSILHEEKEIEDKIKKIANKKVKALKKIKGVGLYTAACIAAEISTKDFKNDGALAKFAGIAPVLHSSANIIKHNADRRGNTRLKQLVRQIAIEHLSKDLQCYKLSRDYYNKKKLLKGHSVATKCLMRQLCKVIYRQITDY